MFNPQDMFAGEDSSDEELQQQEITMQMLAAEANNLETF